jgi:hypothetical protein
MYEKCCSQFSTYVRRHVAFTKVDESLVCSEKYFDGSFRPASLRSKQA